MSDAIRSAVSVLEGAAREFDAAVLSGHDAVAVLTDLGRARRLVDGMVAKAAKRVEDTAAHSRGPDRSAVELTARVVGVSPGEATRAITTAAKLETLPATDRPRRPGPG